MRKLKSSAARLLVLTTVLTLSVNPGIATATDRISFRSVDGRGNNERHPEWGKANTQYIRVGRANYADGKSQMVSGPPARYISNRVFNDVNQNIFSENGVTQFAWTWGQFMDHDLGLRDERPDTAANIAFNANDPLETFTNSFGVIAFDRTPAALGTGVTSTRQQINTISSFIDASNVYGVTDARLDWLRVGSNDGNPTNNGARLMLTDQRYLPLAGARGNVATAPQMDLMGMLTGRPDRAIVAGDVRANENIALTAMHTLFAREHNRIVAALPSRLSEEEKFQIARRVVGAELQYITYTEFLPSLGVRLDRYQGYNNDVNPGLSQEFAVAGYRAHSMIHGEFEPSIPAGTYTAAQLAAFERQGIEFEADANVLVIPLGVAFGNPSLLRDVGIGIFLPSLAAEAQYKNDEQIDNTLRSILFQVPKPGTDPAGCGAPVVNPNCFSGVVDLGAIDIQRGRDHGLPTYNDMRRAYGLMPKQSFEDVTGESTDQFPRDRLIDARNAINDPDILDFVQLRDAAGNVLPADTDEAVVGIRRTTLAARLKAIYGDVDKMDAFVGVVSEKHVRGTEFGELQLAIWTKQFEAARDGDRFFYQNDPVLRSIEQNFRIDYQHTLSEIINMNTGVTLQANVFKVVEEAAPRHTHR
jgi:hypothetical protein